MKGRWVMLDFWGHWCGPCIRQVQDTMGFIERVPEAAGRLSILAKHSSEFANFDALDVAVKPILDKSFRGREFPFPILLDSTNTTVKNFGVRLWPTTVIIDPNGRVVNLTPRTTPLQFLKTLIKAEAKTQPLP